MINKKAVWLLIVVIIIAGGFFGYYKITSNNEIETFNARIFSETVNIQPDKSGKLKTFNVKQSQQVKKGQVIAEILTEESSGSEIKKSVNKQKTTQNIEQEYENAAIMYKDGIISQQEYDNYITSYNAQKNQNEIPAKTNVKITKTEKIYSPIDGIISLNNIQKGDLIGKDNIIAKVNSLHKEINAYFSYSDKLKLTEGLEVEIHIIKYPEKILSGIITSIGEPEAAGLPVTIQFKDDVSSMDLENGNSVIVKINHK